MKTKLISVNSPDIIEIAQKEIIKGHLIALPTDTVYGLAADVNNPKAIESLFLAKGRDFNKSIAVLVSDMAQLTCLTPRFNKNAMLLAGHLWPGALTLVVEKLSSLPSNLSPNSTLGIRMPDHEFARMLLRATGPLATTSANVSGQSNPLTAQDVMDQLGGKVDLIIDGGACPGGVPSTVVDCTKTKPVILRLGTISQKEIENALKE